MKANEVERRIEKCESHIIKLEKELENVYSKGAADKATQRLQVSNAKLLRLRAQLRSIEHAQSSREMP